MKQMRYAVQKGFTLVELLIVVIILAILAAIVVPQFASSTDDAKISSLDTTLSNMRAAIDLYYQQHGEYPGKNTAVTGTCPAGATAGTGTGGAGAQGVTAFTQQLSMYSDADGKSCTIADTTYKYGPYLKSGTLPKNPVTSNGALVVVNAGNLSMAGDGAGLGWKFDILTGKFIANDTNNDPNGVSYDKH